MCVCALQSAGQVITALCECPCVRAALRDDALFVDLGCGDGRVVIEAARRLRCRCIGVELDAELVSAASCAARLRLGAASWPTPSDFAGVCSPLAIDRYGIVHVVRAAADDGELVGRFAIRLATQRLQYRAAWECTARSESGDLARPDELRMRQISFRQLDVRAGRLEAWHAQRSIPLRPTMHVGESPQRRERLHLHKCVPIQHRSHAAPAFPGRARAEVVRLGTHAIDSCGILHVTRAAAEVGEHGLGVALRHATCHSAPSMPYGMGMCLALRIWFQHVSMSSDGVRQPEACVRIGSVHRVHM